ncbi:META domain-containing protein [Methylococcus capsulatus]|nr:META domain-containing protein [Methylococcus capsulatus]
MTARGFRRRADRFGRWPVVSLILVCLAGCAGKPPVASAPQPVPAKPARPVVQKSPEPLATDRREVSPVPGVPLWRWESWDQHGKMHLVSKPEKYTLQLLANGWLKFSAECLKGEGIYETHGDRIVIAVTRSDAGRCRPGPAAEHFIQSLEAASHYHRSGGRLFLDLGRNGGGMSFSLLPD